jgi:hypothetical protein
MQFITGNKFKKICDYILDENGFRKTDVVNDTPIYFVKTDFIEKFISNFEPNTKYKLITHNSDFSVDEKHLDIIQSEKLVHWYGQNINIKHDKVTSIPIGIANEIWQHGDEKKLKKVILENNAKNKIIHCSFDISTNYNERIKCASSMSKNNLKMNNRENFEEYLRSLSKSFFTLSPNGNGIDCHKLWESLYLKTIPVVTNSINVDFYSKLPILIIDTWDNFNFEDLNENLYNEIIKKHNFKEIEIDYYKNKILNYKNGEN